MKEESAQKVRIAGHILFYLYLAALVYFMFFSDYYGRAGTVREYHYNFILFKEIKRFYIYREQLGFEAVLTNLAGNVIGFVPFGLIVPIIDKRKRRFLIMALLTLWLSLAIETLQLVFKVGTFDVDDLLLNTVGGILGYLIFVFSNRIRRKYYG